MFRILCIRNLSEVFALPCVRSWLADCFQECYPTFSATSSPFWPALAWKSAVRGQRGRNRMRKGLMCKDTCRPHRDALERSTHGVCDDQSTLEFILADRDEREMHTRKPGRSAQRFAWCSLYKTLGRFAATKKTGAKIIGYLFFVVLFYAFCVFCFSHRKTTNFRI